MRVKNQNLEKGSALLGRPTSRFWEKGKKTSVMSLWVCAAGKKGGRKRRPTVSMWGRLPGFLKKKKNLEEKKKKRISNPEKQTEKEPSTVLQRKGWWKQRKRPSEQPKTL